MIELSVILPSHNPHRGRLERTLAGLREQTLPGDRWELLLIDNASSRDLAAELNAQILPPRFRLIREPALGLSSARRCGLREAKGDVCIFADDDNVLAPDYLDTVLRLFAAHPKVGALGGKSIPEFEVTPPPWALEFTPLLALRDLGDAPLISHGLRPSGAPRNEYPAYAPIGAGMALRKTAVASWVENADGTAPTDRKGSELTSGGDNDIVLSIMKAGWEVAYFPELSLTHLIPAGRLEADYLARLNHGIQKSWMSVLARYEANPWSPLTGFGAALRKLKAWFHHQPWRSPAARIRWRGVCGHFEGRVT